MLSIYVATYNHEDYIVQALDSILMQKTEYSYEVLVGEDCSTDRTREILKEYEKKHPGKFQIFYREHNMHKQRPNNAGDLKLRCKGKYVIALEGDDYWLDPYKIDKQIKFLESHPDYLAVSHKCLVVDKYSKEKNEVYPECYDKEYTFKHYASEILPGQLTTVMYRNFYNDKSYDISVMQKQLQPGDRVLYFWLLCNGKVHCMDERMSAYRHVTDSGSSFSANFKYRFESFNHNYYNLLVYSRDIKNKEAEKYAELLYFKNLGRGIKEKQFTFGGLFKSLKNVHHKCRVLYLVIKYRINKNILHKKIWF